MTEVDIKEGGAAEKRMRILQVVQKPQRRGAEVFAHQLSAVLRQRGHDVSIAYLYPFAGPAPLPMESADVLLEGREDHPTEKLIGFHPALLRRLLRTIRAFRPSVVQVNGGRALKYGAMARALDSAGGWCLLYRNIGEPQRWMRGTLRRWVYCRLVAPRLDGVVAVSETTLAGLETFYADALGDVPRVAIPRAVDLRRFVAPRTRLEVRSERGAAPTAPVLIYVGSLSAEKRVDRLLEVLPSLLASWPELRLWVLGDGPLRGDLASRARSLGVEEAVCLTGARDDVADHLAAADVLVLSSDTEGIPGVILEAGAAGLPVVASRVGGVPECVEDGATGLLVEAGDAPALEAALRRLLGSPQTARRMGRAARQRVEEQFSLDRVAARYADLYRHLAAVRGEGRQ